MPGGQAWGALRAHGAERLGHGVRAIEDPALMAYLAGNRIPLEVCPTSNVVLGVYAGLDEHPLPSLHSAGIPVTINTDTPALLGTTLSRELSLLETRWRLDRANIDEILLNGVRASFLPPDAKAALLRTFEAELARFEASSLAAPQT